MPTTTPRLGLTLPLVGEDWELDVWNNNFTILDGASANAKEVTSGTRPGSPGEGDIIVETDTGKAQVYLNGAWRNIGTSSGGLAVDSGQQVNIGGSNSAAPLTIHTAAGAGQAIALRVGAETNSRLFINTDGKMDWASGAATSDVSLSRSNVGVLLVSGTLRAGGWADSNGAVTVSQTQNTLGTVTSTSYVEALTGGTPCSFTFIAPGTGKVEVINTGLLDNSTTGRSYQSFIIRSGSTIGSGTIIVDGDDEKAISVLDTYDVGCSRHSLITALTPGNTYNIRQRYKVTTGTGTFLNKELTVKPIMF